MGQDGREVRRQGYHHRSLGIDGAHNRQPFPVYPRGFPPDLIERFEQAIGRRVLGNKVASGTEIIDELGEEHVKTGRPIVYTSADSVFRLPPTKK